jgi:hypothetical protein
MKETRDKAERQAPSILSIHSEAGSIRFHTQLSKANLVKLSFSDFQIVEL